MKLHSHDRPHGTGLALKLTKETNQFDAAQPEVSIEGNTKTTEVNVSAQKYLCEKPLSAFTWSLIFQL